MKRTLRFLLASMLAAGLSGSPARAQRPDAPPAPVDGAFALTAPVLRLLAIFGVPVQVPAPLPNSFELEHAEGWRDVEFPLADRGTGAYLETRGRLEFDRAVLRFGDGGERDVDLSGVSRGNGLYELLAFDAERSVASVTVRARARSARAWLGVRLGR
jgi:hypothetical protein